jgi:hypothetical protein
MQEILTQVIIRVADNSEHFPTFFLDKMQIILFF